MKSSKLDEFITNTRIELCLNTMCLYSRDGNCLLKTTCLDKEGKCMNFKTVEGIYGQTKEESSS